MIKNLPLHKYEQDYYSEPLLEYVKEVIENFWPDEYLIRFVTRLFDKEIANCKQAEYEDAVTEEHFVHTSYQELHANKFKGAYTPNEQRSYSGEISGTLRFYGLDSSKFWYLCLMIKDFVEGATKEGCLIQTATHRSEISNLLTQLELLKPDIFPSITMEPKDVEMELCLKIKKKNSKNAKNITVTKNGHTLLLIQEALSSFLNANSKRTTRVDCPVFDPKALSFLKEDKSLPVKIALFYRYLIWFLNKRTVDKEFISNSKYSVPTSKNLLIARMAYFTGLTDNENFLSKDGEYLRAYISGYENVKNDTINMHYDASYKDQVVMDIIRKMQELNM
jgi:hypothetical protein